MNLTLHLIIEGIQCWLVNGDNMKFNEIQIANWILQQQKIENEKSFNLQTRVVAAMSFRRRYWHRNHIIDSARILVTAQVCGSTRALSIEKFHKLKYTSRRVISMCAKYTKMKTIITFFYTHFSSSYAQCTHSKSIESVRKTNNRPTKSQWGKKKTS